MERRLCSAPMLLIENGKVLRRNLRMELVTMDELLSKLREEGVESPAGVAHGYIETGVDLSVKKD